MADCRAGLVDMVITKSVSRFGRNTVDTLKAVRELKNLKVDVFFEKEGIHTINSEGEILLTLISAVAQNEALSLSENVKWGLRRKYENGSVKSVPCGKFLGYDTAPSTAGCQPSGRCSAPTSKFPPTPRRRRS